MIERKERGAINKIFSMILRNSVTIVENEERMPIYKISSDKGCSERFAKKTKYKNIGR